MLASKLYAPTLREMPADADVVSQQYMLRAGFIRKMAGGIYTYLPLAWRSLRKIETIIREEMEAIGAQEIMMPIVQPAELWQESGRWSVYGEEMFRLADRHGREYCLAPTHEELITTLVRGEVSSYRKLPVVLYQMQNKYRDERRPRYGLMRGREFIMKDAYSFSVDKDDAMEQYRLMYEAYTRIFTRVGLHFKPVKADAGAIGGDNTHEFMAFADSGEADVVYCTKCDYAANVEIGVPAVIHAEEEPYGELKLADTPHANTIAAVAEYLGLPFEKTIKAVVYKVDDLVVLAIVRGDHQVNEIALQHAVGKSIEPEMAPDEDLIRVGLTAGFISPVGLRQTDGFAIVVDESVMEMYNVCGGGNVKDAHYVNINPKRDFNLDDIVVAPIRLISDEDVCPECRGELQAAKGIEVGQVFYLGTKYSEALNTTYLNQEGRPVPMVMGSYGIGVSRTLAALIEQFHDEDGIMWPASVAPYEVVVVPVNVKDEVLMSAATDAYDALTGLGAEVVLDDRNERAGVKFKDADLIGYPIRITIGKTVTESGEAEVKIRKTGEVVRIPVTELPVRVKELLRTL